MSKRCKRNFIAALSLFILLRFLDLYTTYIYTPELLYEWNPVVTVLGFSWFGMILTQTLLITFIATLSYFYFARQTLIRFPAHLSYNDFVHYYFYDKIEPLSKRLFTFPRNIGRLLAFNGFVLLFLGIIISIFAIINNLLIMTGNMHYSDFIINYGNYFYPFFIITIAVLSFYYYFFIEFRMYKKQCLPESMCFDH